MSISKILKTVPPVDNQIGPGPHGVPQGSPNGYKILANPSQEVGSIAKSLLSGEYGTITIFQIDKNKYLGRVEPHPPYSSRDKGPTNWHKGVTVYEPLNQISLSDTQNKTSGRARLLQRITKFLDSLN